MTPKPIVVIYLPEHYSAFKIDTPMELMRALNGGFGNNSDPSIRYTDYWRDYYWFCFTESDIDAPRFEVFYEKDFTKVQFDELETILNKAMEQQRQPATKPNT